MPRFFFFGRGNDSGGAPSSIVELADSAVPGRADDLAAVYEAWGVAAQMDRLSKEKAVRLRAMREILCKAIQIDHRERESRRALVRECVVQRARFQRARSSLDATLAINNFVTEQEHTRLQSICGTSLQYGIVDAWHGDLELANPDGSLFLRTRDATAHLEAQLQEVRWQTLESISNRPLSSHEIFSC